MSDGRERFQEGLDSEADSTQTNDPQASGPGPRFGFASNVGLKRKVDEDSLLVLEVTVVFDARVRRRVLLAISDGMSGHPRGEIASRIVIRTLVGVLCNVMASNTAISAKMASEEIVGAIQEAGKRMNVYSSRVPGSTGMGATVVLAMIDGDQIYSANLGDSRVYVINREGIRRVTKDHSYVQELVDSGKIEADAAKTHPRRNLVTRVVAADSDSTPRTFADTLVEGDIVLVCSDGIHLYIDDDELRKIILEESDPQRVCDKLIAMANGRGGADNVSVIMFPFGSMKE